MVMPSRLSPKSFPILGVLLSTLAWGTIAKATTPRQLVEVVDISSPVVSPDGGGGAFRIEQACIERNTYDSFWYVQDMDGAAAPRRVADGGVPLRDSAGVSVPPSVAWSSDGRWVYYRALMDGRIDVWRAATDGSGAEPLTLDPADVREFALSPGGSALAYSARTTRDQVIAAEQA